MRKIVIIYIRQCRKGSVLYVENETSIPIK